MCCSKGLRLALGAEMASALPASSKPGLTLWSVKLPLPSFFFFFFCTLPVFMKVPFGRMITSVSQPVNKWLLQAVEMHQFSHWSWATLNGRCWRRSNNYGIQVIKSPSCSMQAIIVTLRVPMATIVWRGMSRVSQLLNKFCTNKTSVK